MGQDFMADPIQLRLLALPLSGRPETAGSQ
jgi:hypothetical protein